VAKTKQQKQKEREKRVAQKKLADTAKRREIAKTTADAAPAAVTRGGKVMTGGVKQKAQVTSAKPTVAHRRAGG